MVDVNPQMAYGEEKNYFWEAVLSGLLFYFGMWLGGFISSIYFLLDMRRTRRVGRPTRNTGCLWAVLIFHSLVTVAALVFFLLNRL